VAIRAYQSTRSLTTSRKEETLQRRREELAEKGAAVVKLPPSVQVYHGDFLKDYHILGEGSVDCIITDPPYVKDWLENYEGFARAAEYVLKPGGFLITYVGHIHLDRILDQMCRHLDFYWIAALKHAGTTKAVHSRSVMCGFKPILIFHKPPRMAPKRYFCDVILGTGREKSAHEWQQGKEELRQIFEPFTDPGDTVLDPFMGSGTVLDMAREMGRKAIGFDIDAVNVQIVRGRGCRCRVKIGEPLTQDTLMIRSSSSPRSSTPSLSTMASGLSVRSGETGRSSRRKT